MKKIYMAGPLFSEAEVNQRLRECALLQKSIKDRDLHYKVFSPINAPQNDKSKLPTAKDIFLGDEKELMESAVIFADLSGEDAGVMMELGMVIHKDIKIYAYLTDIRMATAGNYEKEHIPWGYNQFVIGALEQYNHKIYYSFNEALEAYEVDHK